MRRLTALCVISCLATPCFAQESVDTDHPRVREAIHLMEVWVDAERAYKEIPGIAMGFVYDQQLVWSQGFGYADPEQQTATTPQTIHSICSISKLFTSIGVMQQRDAGRLRLDDAVGDHLSWFNIRDKYPDAPPVTIEGILTHSSGLPRESDYPYWSPPDFPFPTHEQIVDRLGQQEELYPSYTYFQYSNLGLTLAGEIVAEVSGETFDDYMRRHILDPLGMEHTFTAIPVDEHGRRMAVGYTAGTRDGTRHRLPVFEARGISPAAGFASNVEDLARFASWQFRVLFHDADELLARNTLKEMYRVHFIDPEWETHWGLGFATWRSGGKTFVGHGGSCPGYRSSLNIQPSGKTAAIVMANASGVNTGNFTGEAQAILAPAVRAALDDDGEAEALDADFEKYLGNYSVLPWGGEVAVLPWKGKLALLYLPTDDPSDDIVKLKHIEGDTFQRVLDDGELGEEIRFDVEDGRAVRMWRHSNFWTRLP